MRYLRIPKERIGVLIGPNGDIKKTIEKTTKINLEIDSEEGEVTLNDTEVTDPLGIFKAENIVRAIARGFSPEHAFHLLKDDNDFFLFDIHDYVGKKPSHIKRLKSRIIGSHGKTKRTIEHLTGANISIYGHTIGVIADLETIECTKKALDMLLSGSKHASVYRYLEHEIRRIRLGR